MGVSCRGPGGHEEATGFRNLAPSSTGVEVIAMRLRAIHGWFPNHRLECTLIHLSGIGGSPVTTRPRTPVPSENIPAQGKKRIHRMMMTDIPDSQLLLLKALPPYGPMAPLLLGLSLKQVGKPPTSPLAQPIATREERTVLVIDRSVSRRPLSAEPAGKLQGGASHKGAGRPGGFYPIATRAG